MDVRRVSKLTLASNDASLLAAMAPSSAARKPSGSRSPGPTRARLLAAARQAFGELGFAATRVDDIVERAGTSHGTFYRYFEDKKDALVGLTQDVARSLYGTAVAPALDTSLGLRGVVRARLAAFISAYTEHWEVIHTWRQAEGVHAEVEEVRARIRRAISSAVAEMLERDREKELIESGVDTEIAATAFVVMAEGFADDWLYAGRAFSEADVDQITDLWMRGTYRREALVP